MDQSSSADGTENNRPGRDRAALAFLVYAIAFVTGAIVMSFEMLGSRYLNPYFGSGIYTWASLISTVLAALTIGYFVGGWLADRAPSPTVLGATVLIGSAYLVVLPAFAGSLLQTVMDNVEDVRMGSLASSFALMFFPVTFLGMYSPFAIRLLLASAQRSGVVSGAVYGVSTAGSILGTLGTAFLLMPTIGSRAITLTLGIAGVIAGVLLMALKPLMRRAHTAVVAAAILVFAGHCARAEDLRPQDLVDLQVREQLLRHADGKVASLESEYNAIFVTKTRQYLLMSTRLRRDDYTQSVINLQDPDDLPARYMQNMTVGMVYPDAVKRVLMVGLGGGATSTYLGRHTPELIIDVVEIDPAIIQAAKTYFGIRETARVHYLEADGRVYLNRHKEPYDLILLDAFQRGDIPFHLLTKEFFTLVKDRLTPNGAVAFNLAGGTKLYASALATLRAVFPTVDLYPPFADNGDDGTQVIAVATLGPRLERAALMQKAAALQERHRFHIPLTRVAALRVEKPDVPQGDVLTDDFAPVGLYETMRVGAPKH